MEKARVVISKWKSVKKAPALPAHAQMVATNNAQTHTPSLYTPTH